MFTNGQKNANVFFRANFPLYGNTLSIVLITPQTSVTITCGIQPTGVVTMAMKVLHITLVTCAFVICLI